MLNISKKKVCDVGSCNFCDRETFNKSEGNFIYPYKMLCKYCDKNRNQKFHD